MPETILNFRCLCVEIGGLKFFCSEHTPYCESCHGTGQVVYVKDHISTCAVCRGSGQNGQK